MLLAFATWLLQDALMVQSVNAVFQSCETCTLVAVLSVL
jgi:hypothetical protein